MSPALTRRGLVQGGAAGVPVTFDAEAFVDDLLAAGCQVSVHQPIGRDVGPAYWIVYPADFDGTPTESEREVRVRWAVAAAACPDADVRILAVCQRRAERHREERVRKLGEVAS